MVEIKLDTKETAFKIRNTFVTKKKGGEDFGRLHIANSVCLATRVRVDILRAFAKQFGGDGGDDMYVSAYSSRPVLHIKERNRTQRPYALTFADAIARYGMTIDDDNLGEAYRRAGNSFKGQLEQHFVVLKERHAQGEHRQGMEQRKRPLGTQAKFPQTSGIARGKGRGRMWSSERGSGRGSRGYGGYGSTKSARLGN